MATNQESEFLKIGDVCWWLKASRPTIYRWVKLGNFPRPVKFGAAQQSAARWLKSDVQQWVDQKTGVAA